MPRIGDDHRELAGGEGGHDRGFVPTGRFEDDQRWGEYLAAADQVADPRLVVDHGAGLPAGPVGELELRLRDIDAEERHTASRIHGSRRPHLAGCGLMAQATVRLSAKKGCHAPANERSRGP